VRILIAHPGPAFSVHDVYVGWVEALRELGQQVYAFNLDDRLAFYDSTYIQVDEQTGLFRKALTADQAIQLATNGLAASLFKLRPHLLLSISSFFADTDVLDQARRLGTRVVLLHTESPYEDDRQLVLAPHADLNLLNDPTNLDRFTQVAPTVYQPHGYRPSLHRPGPSVPEMVCDLAFVGTGYPSRRRFFEAMDLDGLDVLLGGNWQGLAEDSPIRPYVAHKTEECLDNEQAVQVYRSARIGMNLYRREAAHPELIDGWAVGPREIEMAATGLFFLREARGEGDELLPSLPTFTDPEEASKLLRWYLDHPEERQDAAMRARQAVADRTFAQHAAGLLRRLDTKE
jgi:spore maturation protein CgeB